jgi:superfamily II DNA or RNA helicase
MNKNVKQEEVQMMALSKLRENQYTGLLAMCTGSGKSRIPILALRELFDKYGEFPVLLVVPTEKLRDENWKEEFSKWGESDMYSKIRRECYASLHKLSGLKIGVLILDEGHRLTELGNEFFKNNIVRKVIILTATVPEDKERRQLLNNLAKTVFTYTLTEGVKDGVVAPYRINVVQTLLDNTERYIKKTKRDGGGKKHTSFHTEYSRYIDLTNGINGSEYYHNWHMAMQLRLLRMRHIYNLKSKAYITKYILENILKEKRTIVFAGSKTQADLIGDHKLYSGLDDVSFTKFQNEEINHLVTIKMLNEGMNLKLDAGLVTQLNSKQLDLIQRIGRAVRYREGHIAEIWVIVCQYTVDEEWFKKAIQSFDPSVIKYIDYKELKNWNERVIEEK